MKVIVGFLLTPDFITFLLRPYATLDYQTFHAEPQSDMYERLRSLRGLWTLEERTERPSVYVESTRRY